MATKLDRETALMKSFIDKQEKILELQRDLVEIRSQLAGIMGAGTPSVGATDQAPTTGSSSGRGDLKRRVLETVNQNATRDWNAEEIAGHLGESRKDAIRVTLMRLEKVHQVQRTSAGRFKSLVQETTTDGVTA